MSLTVIELNDIGLTASTGDGLLLDSPGYAVLDGDELYVGKRAYEIARIRPRWTNNQFWSRLSLEPLAGATRRYRNNADLAHAHLKAVWESISDGTDAVIFAVPGTFERDQLALLLGIASELRIPVKGLVDAGVAAAATVERGNPILHLDIQLHRVVLSLFAQGPRLKRSGVFVIADEGLSALRDTWVGVIEDVFVRNTRFDPMHVAETEQMLYDRLGEWLDTLKDQESVTVELEAGGRTHSVVVKADLLAQANAKIYPQIVQHIRGRTRTSDSFRLLLSHRLSAFPGLRDTLGMLAGCELVQLDHEAVARGVLAHVDAIVSGGEAVSFLTGLPVGADNGGSVAEHATDGPAPTHLLYQSRAYRIDEEPLLIGSTIPARARGIAVNSSTEGVSRHHCSIYRRDDRVQVEDHSSYGTFVNDRKIEGSTVAVIGDSIGIGHPGREFRLIEVADEDGT